MSDNWALCWQFARYEMRGSVARFRIFLAALMLGVAAIGAVGSVAQSMRSGIEQNARDLLGGDFELSSLHIPPSQELLNYADSIGARSNLVQMRAMVTVPSDDQNPFQRKLVELKAVDDLYPLVGKFTATPDLLGVKALENFGAIADPDLLRSLNLNIGDHVQLGDITIEIKASLISEPDLPVSFISYGPRLFVSAKTLEASGLQKEGAMITYRSRIVLTDPSQLAETHTALSERVEGSYVRVRTVADAGDDFTWIVEEAELFLTLVGLAALLIGGIGVGGAVRAWLLGRMNVIATLKCLGASSRLIFRVYMLQVMVMAGLGVGAGIIISALVPYATIGLFQSYVNVHLVPSIYPAPLILAGSFGILTTFVFAIWPLSRTRHIRAAHLFRSLLVIPPGRPAPGAFIAVGAGCIGLLGLALQATQNLPLSLSFIGGTFIVLGLLSSLGEGLLFVLRRLRAPHYVPAHLALSAITRKGSPLRVIIIAFGLGLSVLVFVVLIQFNLVSQFNQQASEEAPDWFFHDIQPQQITPFLDSITQFSPETVIEKTPILRGRVTAVNGVPSSQTDENIHSSWILRGDRAVTWLPEPPPNAVISRGEWWPADYQGEPLISITEEMATDFKLSIGDTISLNILGRKITAEIANTRVVNLHTIGTNFIFIMSPGLLDKAPYSWIVTTKSPSKEIASQIEKNTLAQFNNITSIFVRQAYATITKVINLMGTAIQLTAIVTLLSGLAVLAGTVANSEAQRFSDFLILKILGARRQDIIIAWFLEYALLGIITAIIASFIGTLISWALITFVIEDVFLLNIKLVLVTAFAGAGVTMLLGMIGAMRTLNVKPGPYLRETG